MLWVVPVGIAFVMAVPVILGIRRTAQEAAALRRSLGALAELRGPVDELRAEARAVAGRVPELQLRTRPALPPAP